MLWVGIGYALVVCGPLFNAVGNRLIAGRRRVLGVVMLASASAAQVASYRFITESEAAALGGGLVVVWTLVVARAYGETVVRENWVAAGVVLLGCSVVVAFSPVQQASVTVFPRAAFHVGSIVTAAVLVSPESGSAVVSAVAAAIVGGFTDTYCKAAVGTFDPLAVTATVVSASAQLILLDRALVRFGDRAVNPIYIPTLVVSAVSCASVSYGEFERADAAQVTGFLVGAAIATAGATTIHKNGRPHRRSS